MLVSIIQLYTDKSHFVYELLQNAEDAGATEIRFVQYPDRLEVMHDGKSFTTENLQGLCDIGQSDKVNDLNQIGEFEVPHEKECGHSEVFESLCNSFIQRSQIFKSRKLESNAIWEHKEGRIASRNINGRDIYRLREVLYLYGKRMAIICQFLLARGTVQTDGLANTEY